jgi:hypothetical protein
MADAHTPFWQNADRTGMFVAHLFSISGDYRTFKDMAGILYTLLFLTEMYPGAKILDEEYMSEDMWVFWYLHRNYDLEKEKETTPEEFRSILRDFEEREHDCMALFARLEGERATLLAFALENGFSNRWSEVVDISALPEFQEISAFREVLSSHRPSPYDAKDYFGVVEMVLEQSDLDDDRKFEIEWRARDTLSC